MARRPSTIPNPPACTRMGSHCHSLRVLLRVSSREKGPLSGDHEATWLLGHTERLSFGELWEDEEQELYCNSVLHVPCRFLREGGNGSARCTAHGFSAPTPLGRRRPQPRRLGGDRFRIVEEGEVRDEHLRKAAPAARSLPVLPSDNPCLGVPCRTTDNARGAACCRDMVIEIECSRKQVRLESLIRSRKSPYLCKVERDGDFTLDAELISACGYLDEDGVSCSLHGRLRADGRPAKPALCSSWPPKRQELHPACVFAPKKRK